MNLAGAWMLGCDFCFRVCVVLVCCFALTKFYSFSLLSHSRPVAPYPKFELILVMIIVPVVLNTIQFWITDNFLMASPKESTLETDATPVAEDHRPSSAAVSEDSSDSQTLLPPEASDSRA
jgi:hypothetical protein